MVFYPHVGTSTLSKANKNGQQPLKLRALAAFRDRAPSIAQHSCLVCLVTLRPLVIDQPSQIPNRHPTRRKIFHPMINTSKDPNSKT